MFLIHMPNTGVSSQDKHDVNLYVILKIRMVFTFMQVDGVSFQYAVISVRSLAHAYLKSTIFSKAQGP